NLQQILQHDIYNPCLFHYIEVGECDDCRWRNRPQKCACCRRNLNIKDCYEREVSHEHDEGRKEIDVQKEVFLLALSDLRPVSREQVEKVWRGKWKCHGDCGVTEC